jgi:hypothetical protein
MRYKQVDNFSVNLPAPSFSMTSFGSSLNETLVCGLDAIAIVIGQLSGNGYPVLRPGRGSSTVEDEEEEGQSGMELAPVLVEGRHIVVPMRHSLLRGRDTIMSELFAPSIYGMTFTKELVESRNMVLASEEEAGSKPIPHYLP